MQSVFIEKGVTKVLSERSRSMKRVSCGASGNYNHCFDTVGVVGSIPIARTIYQTGFPQKPFSFQEYNKITFDYSTLP